MRNARICAVITDKNFSAVRAVENMADFFELRIDLAGKGWEKLAGKLRKPWIAANRDTAHGGKWRRSEEERVAELFKAVELGADIIDIETDAAGIEDLVKRIKKQTKCMISFHDWEGTPPLDYLEGTVQQQLSLHADLCKVIATARHFDDNITMLDLIKKFPQAGIISFAMGTEGLVSRILCPLVGGYLTYASIKEGGGSAPGQITVAAMHSIYRMIKR
ncbi:MAG: type I 3-dehydroquinate dehydratase [Dehalococcoidia bacterium]|nr:type I 3-dehydroquinate dehydratase [Dehalococcoidia bacterium]